MVDIYIITNKCNGKQYVGKTQVGYKQRFKQHCNAYKNGCRNYISCAIHKYGKENFTTQLITRVSDDTWEYWEKFYIKKCHTHFSEGGYNISYGGDSNPMDVPSVREKHLAKMRTPEFREKLRLGGLNRHHTERTKELCRKCTLANLDICTAGFKRYDESKKVRVAIVQNDKIVKEFDSASDACEYCGRARKEAGNLLRKGVDKFRKNGKRCKYYGYEWTRL